MVTIWQTKRKLQAAKSKRISGRVEEIFKVAAGLARVANFRSRFSEHKYWHCQMLVKGLGELSEQDQKILVQYLHHEILLTPIRKFAERGRVKW